MNRPDRLEELESQLEPLQLELLKHVEADPGLLRARIRELGVSTERLVKWLCDDGFRGAFLERCARAEEIEFPGVLAAVRDRALADASTEGKSSSWAKLYLDTVLRLAGVPGRKPVLEGVYPEEVGVGQPGAPDVPDGVDLSDLG